MPREWSAARPQVILLVAGIIFLGLIAIRAGIHTVRVGGIDKLGSPAKRARVCLVLSFAVSSAMLLPTLGEECLISDL